MTRLENTLFNQIDFELQNASMLCSYGFEVSWVILYHKMNFLKEMFWNNMLSSWNSLRRIQVAI